MDLRSKLAEGSPTANSKRTNLGYFLYSNLPFCDFEDVKKYIFPLILFAFTSNTYGEILTVILQRSGGNYSLKLFSDDPSKSSANPTNKSSTTFFWDDRRPDIKFKGFVENKPGASKVWPTITKDLLSPRAEFVFAHFFSLGYRMTSGFQRVETNLSGDNDIQDIWTFSKPDAKK